METLEIQTSTRSELVDITDGLREAVERSGVEDGVCVVFVPHTTAAVTVNEAHDPDVARDIVAALDRLAPPGPGYRHREGNADAHIKAVLVGSSVRVPVADGRLLLGRWQGVFFCEFDGPRRRKIEIRVIEN
ncbi:YjbQ family protein [candidate division WOR-3 bacterium]|nr:YjbQ family protein [candidate division WOR-3 bacterium]